MSDLISRQAAIDALGFGAELLRRVLDDTDVVCTERAKFEWGLGLIESCISDVKELPSAQPERLTDDDFETIRIHLNAFKENLCNQRRWKEAEEYQRIIDRFMSFASAQPRRGKWAGKGDSEGFGIFICDNCGKFAMMEYDFCPNCGSYNGGKDEGWCSKGELRGDSDEVN